MLERLRQTDAVTTCTATLYFWFSNIVQKGDIMERIYDELHARGCTPQARESVG